MHSAVCTALHIRHWLPHCTVGPWVKTALQTDIDTETVFTVHSAQLKVHSLQETVNNVHSTVVCVESTVARVKYVLSFRLLC